MEFFVTVFYLNLTMLLIIATVTIQTCVCLHEVRNENGMFTQVSVFSLYKF